VQVSKAGEDVCGDDWDWRMRDARLAVIVADGLGHGAAAHEPAREAVATFRREHELPPAWRRAVQTSSASLELTTKELEELGERFESLLDEFRGREPRRGTRTVVISFGAAAEPK
jgi:serine/threonine protein phosphatase PrpC